MFRFEKSILINQTPHHVFEFVANPANIPVWRSDISSAKFAALPLEVDDTIEEIDTRDATVSVVRLVEVVPEKLIVYKVMSGGMYLPRRELIFKQEDGRTIFTVVITVKSDGFAHWMEPTSAQDYSLKWENNLFSLKRVMEEGPITQTNAD